MSQEKIRLQVLDIVDTPIFNEQIDLTLGNATGSLYAFWTAPPFASRTNSSATVSFSKDDPHYLEDILSTPLIVGESYLLSFKTNGMQAPSGYTGYLGFDTLGGVSSNAKLQADGSYSEIFVATGTSVRIYSNESIISNTPFTGQVIPQADILNVSIRRLNLDINDNIVGEIDITDSEDFPLALTYAVSDGRDLDNRFGDYSKTFEVPATKNNNKLFANSFNVKMVDNKDITSLKPCRILVGETEFFAGVLQLNGTSQTSSPDSYSCTIYGGNFAWTSKLKEKKLCNIYDSETFDYTFADISASFNDTYANSEVVFPLISYGDFWPNPGSGFAYPDGKVNLSDETDTSQDWRPSFWVYNMLQKIFNNIGYTIDSNFIEGSEFKKLISHYPPTGTLRETEGNSFITQKYWNQDSPTGSGGYGIWDAFTQGGNPPIVTSSSIQVVQPCDGSWVTGVVGGTNMGDDDGAGVTQWQDIILDTVINDDESNYDPTTGYWTCTKSGFYNFAASVNLIVGNYDNSQTTDGVISAGSNGGLSSNYGKFQVGIKIEMYDSSGASVGLGAFDNFDTPQTETPYLNQFGKHLSQSSGDAPYAGTSIPVLVAVKKQMQNPYAWWVPVGYKVNIQVAVKFNFASSTNSNVNPTNAKIGYISLSDESRSALNGNNPQHFINGDSYYANVHDGWIGVPSASYPVGNVKQIWQLNEKPYFKVEPVANDGFTIGTTYNISDCLPCDINQTDFIKSLAQMFNLQFRTDSQSKKVYIEPYDNFFKDKSFAMDWSNKIDYSKESKDTFPVGLSSEMVWEYKSDGSDGLVKFVNESFRDSDSKFHFFNHLEELGDRYKKGTQKIVNPVFSSTWTDWNADSGYNINPKLMPVINKSVSVYGYGVQANPTRPEKIIKYNPRIMKYNGMVLGPNDPANTTQLGMMTAWSYFGSAFSGQTDTYHGSSFSPRAMFVDWEDISGDLFSNLSFDNEKISPPLSDVEYENLGLYDLFWKNMIEQMKSNPRIRVSYFKLDISDMINIDLTKLVYVDGSYWKINKIVDFSPAKNELTKVELIQWTDIVPLPNRKQ